MKRGELVQLVRWRPAADGWAYDVVDGLYERRDRGSITLQVEGGADRVQPGRVGVVRCMTTAEDLQELAQLNVGDVVALAPDSPAHPEWTVRSRDARFLVLSRPSDLDESTEIYTIADLVAGVRGPCNLLGGGWDLNDPEWADKLLRALNYDLQVTDQLRATGGPVSLAGVRVHVSERNNVPLALTRRKSTR